MIGRLIDGRYQVRSRIARGGMATVYLATDLRLERRVAIKIMHNHLADDSQFKERFIQEARSAARLAHPNVVNVFDQGQDSEMAYLVMEYLPGITLRELLQEHKVLTAEQTIDILDAVLAGLAAAHKAGIVHRDLKPENVLLADDGRIKIGDFGLARAATAQTATGAALLGTIAYLAPELVTRGIADTRSDIYAVGIMTYEMLAGEQPFKGTQPMQIAYQHANDTVPTPSTKNPKVPAELDELVLWATARDPEERPRDARVMLEQLHETEEQLRTSLRPAATQVQRTMVLPPASATTVLPNEDVTQVLGPRKPAAASPVVSDSASKLATKSKARRARGWWLFALVLLLAGGAGGAGWWFGPGPGGQVVLPSDVEGMTQEDARATLTELGVVVADAVVEDTHPTMEPGLVLRTEPGGGSAVQRGSEVSLVVSIGPRNVDLPSLVGIPRTDAEGIIAQSWVLGDVVEQFSGDVEAGIVLDALDEAGATLQGVAQYPEQKRISLVVSAGPVPDVIGMSAADAESELRNAGLVPQIAEQREYSSDIEEGAVLRVAPAGDSEVLRKGDGIILVLSDGPEPVVLPDLQGYTRDQAIAELEAIGLRVSYNPIFAPFPDATVSETNPGAGETVEVGSTVGLVLQLFG